jgi:predicted N-acyltransferase
MTRSGCSLSSLSPRKVLFSPKTIEFELEKAGFLSTYDRSFKWGSQAVAQMYYSNVAQTAFGLIRCRCCHVT